jgi:hypothetical protein
MSSSAWRKSSRDYEKRSWGVAVNTTQGPQHVHGGGLFPEEPKNLLRPEKPWKIMEGAQKESAYKRGSVQWYDYGGRKDQAFETRAGANYNSKIVTTSTLPYEMDSKNDNLTVTSGRAMDRPTMTSWRQMEPTQKTERDRKQIIITRDDSKFAKENPERPTDSNVEASSAYRSFLTTKSDEPLGGELAPGDYGLILKQTGESLEPEYQTSGNVERLAETSRAIAEGTGLVTLATSSKTDGGEPTKYTRKECDPVQPTQGVKGGSYEMGNGNVLEERTGTVNRFAVDTPEEAFAISSSGRIKGRAIAATDFTPREWSVEPDRELIRCEDGDPNSKFGDAGVTSRRSRGEMELFSETRKVKTEAEVVDRIDFAHYEFSDDKPLTTRQLLLTKKIKLL